MKINQTSNIEYTTNIVLDKADLVDLLEHARGDELTDWGIPPLVEPEAISLLAEGTWRGEPACLDQNDQVRITLTWTSTERKST